MVDAIQVLSALDAEFAGEDASPEFRALYTGETPPLDGVFAVVHERLNEHFRFMNLKMDRGRHFNADDSRELIALIKAIAEMRKSLARAGIEMKLRPDYQAVLTECKAFLVPSGGSPIPPEFGPIEIERFEPAFSTSEWAPERTPAAEQQKMVMVGEGSFAIVQKYVDPLYGMTIAVKKAKKGISERDLERFRKEFELLSQIRFPYIVKAYKYDEAKNSFTMEYCDETLGQYVKRTHPGLPWGNRKRIALQFLYALNFLHHREILHRDISRNNILVQHFDSGAVLVKLSDFGLHKDPNSDFTRASTELKGSILDPSLESFKDFTVTNDIYAAGVILSFLFSGRLALGNCVGRVEEIVRKATATDVASRYATVAELIQDVESLEPPPLPSGDTPA